MTGLLGEQKRAAGYTGRFGARVLEFIAALLKTGNPAATMDRLFVSRHVGDLRIIVGIALMLFCISVLPLVVYSIETTPTRHHEYLWNVIKIAAGFTGLLATMLAVVGAVCAWAYKVGSARLGVVDLFACEISTLCRVATVIDSVGRLLDRMKLAKQQTDGFIVESPESQPVSAKSGPQVDNDQSNSQLPIQFTSAENYFPVFEGNTRDLQSLEARVVINITSFYTYMKAVRDLMRTAAALKAEPITLEGTRADQLHVTSHNALRDVLYMLFLGLEAGRDSVQDLVEFEPERAERIIVILLSELKAYLFLLQEFINKEDMRTRRLLLRWETYKKVVTDLCSQIETGMRHANEAKGTGRSQTEISVEEVTQKLWRASEQLLPDLRLLYDKIQNHVYNSSSAPEGI